MMVIWHTHKQDELEDLTTLEDIYSQQIGSPRGRGVFKAMLRVTGIGLVILPGKSNM